MVSFESSKGPFSSKTLPLQKCEVELNKGEAKVSNKVIKFLS